MKVNLHWTNKSKGIYIIKNNITDECYVGSTRNTLYNRLNENIRLLRKNKHHNYKLQNSFNKYGEGNFSYRYKILDKDDQYILRFEEKFIHIFKPYFNICLFPTIGGKPNQGKKFNEEWIVNLIKNKKQYKHSTELLNYITIKNKKNACRLNFQNEFSNLNFDSWIEAALYFSTTTGALMNAYSRYSKWKGYFITQLTKQKKMVRLYYNEDILIFNSASECDKFLNMWRGATSFYSLRDGKINDFRVEYIN